MIFTLTMQITFTKTNSSGFYKRMHRVDILSKHCYWAEKKLKDISEYVFIYKHYLKKKKKHLTIYPTSCHYD